MVLVAASLGLALYSMIGISGTESAIIALAALTFMILYNAVSMRLRDRTDVGGQIADLSRGTADLARQVAEFGRRLASIEGRRGTPKTRPPYPAVSGLWGKPTLLNNVETYANIAPIIRNGGKWFASMGSERSKGTKVFALTGKITNTGLVEVPMGIKLREIIEVIGGGVPDGHTFKAVQTGGPSGGCIPAEMLDLGVSYDALMAVGSIMGSGGMIVMDDTSCMVNVARFFVEFCMTESCGKCIPCRAGTAQMFTLLTRICNGKGTMADLDTLVSLCETIKETSLCGLGMTAPNPVLSTLKYFRNEYIEHIVNKRCPAGVCTMVAQVPETPQEVLA